MKHTKLNNSHQIFFSKSSLSLAIGLSIAGLSPITYATEAESEDSVKALPTLVLQAQGNWLEDANAETVHHHAGARTIIDRKQLDATGTTSIREALKQIPGVQVQVVVMYLST